MLKVDKRILNFIVIISLTFFTYFWTAFIFKVTFNWNILLVLLFFRIIASFILFRDYSLSWSKVSQKSFLIKSFVYIIAFLVYLPFLYGDVRFAFLISELFFYLFSINFAMYFYYFLINRSRVTKTKTLVIYGAGKAGIKLEEEFKDSEYKIKYFIDDNQILQKRTIDSIPILSLKKLKRVLTKDDDFDLLVIAMPSAEKERITQIYDRLNPYFKEISILPSLDKILREEDYKKQLKDITVEDLLARHPKDLDTNKIESFIREKVVLITGAGGSIGSEISRQCKRFGAKQLILLDHSEFNLYKIVDELDNLNVVPVMQTVRNLNYLDTTFKKYKPQIVIHAAAYKHVPLVEDNILEGISNNIVGTKNCIDISIKHNVEKFVLISTDKAVRPTNVMGTTKRICELYAQNVNPQNTEIVAVRFGNVLGSSGSVIPKFKSQIELGKPITVTHPDITRYFMLIPEACELVLQAASIGKGGEIFILDMGEPIKIVDLAKKMIELSGRNDITIEYCGLRPGEKLYEELLINDSDKKTEYESITVASPTHFNIEELNAKINELLKSDDRIKVLKEIVPEFNHQTNT